MKVLLKYQFIPITLITFLFVSVSLAQQTLSVSELKEDADLIKKSLVQFHGGLYRYNSPKDFEKKFLSFKEKLNKPLPKDEFYKLISQLLNEIKCSHTNLNPYNQRKETKESLFDRRVYLPFYFEIIDEKMVVKENASSYALPRGSIISTINGISTEEIIMNLLASTSSDGMGTKEHRIKSLEVNRSSGAEYATFDIMFPLYYPLIDSSFMIEAINFSTKKKTKFEVPAMTKNERTQRMAERYGKTPSYDNGWKFEVWQDSTAYIKIDHFFAWQLSFKVDDFFKNTFEEIHEKQAKNLIIDIRNSGGGSTQVYTELFKYMFENEVPCKFFEKSLIRNTSFDTTLVKHVQTYDGNLLKMIKRGVPDSLYNTSDDGELIVLEDNCSPIKAYETRFKGDVYLLVSSANTSASFAFAHYAQQYQIATLIGQETGGNLLGFNGGGYLFFYLPNSGFEFDIPTQAFFYPDATTDSGVIPDHLIEKIPENVGNEIDTEMIKVKDLIKRKK